MPTPNYLLERVSQTLREVVSPKRLSALQISEAQSMLESLYEQSDMPGIISFLKKTEKEYDVNLSASINFTNTISAIADSTNTAAKIETPEGLYEGLKMRLQDKRKQIVYLKSDLSYDACKVMIKQIVRDMFDESDDPITQNRFVWPFIISENFETTGEVLLKTSDKPQSVVLVSNDYFETDKGEPKFYCRMFGEKINKKNMHDYSENFFIYNFDSDEKQPYLLFSKKELTEGHCRVKGMYVGVADEIKIGSAVTAPTNLNILFATEVASDVRKIEEWEFWNMVHEWDHEKLASFVFGKCRHPPFFEKLILVWLFSGKFSGFPLHLGWIAQNGTGKTQVLEGLVESQFGETRWDATTSTRLSLVPSYGQVNIEPGYVLRTRRVGAADEFFSGFMRGGKRNDRLGAETAFLTSLLEHKTVPLGSGKHTQVFGKARAKFLFATNPVSRLTTMSDCAAELPRQFMSRVLWYVQTKSHVAFVNANKAKINRLPKEDTLPLRDNEFIMAYDYLNTFTMEIPEQVDEDILQRYVSILPDELLQEVYLGRSQHHILCLLDGMAKYNSIVQHRGKFECTMEDVREADKLFGTLISTWNENVNLQAIPLELRYQYMNVACQKVFDELSKHPGQSAPDLQRATGVSGIQYALDSLHDSGLVKSYTIPNGGTEIRVWHTFEREPLPTEDGLSFGINNEIPKNGQQSL